MIYLPKAFERYLSALRLYVQMSVLNGGGVKPLLQLKKINIAEALYFKEERSPEYIVKLSNSLLGAAVILLMQKGIKLSVFFSGGGVYLINRRLYTALLSELVSLCKDGCVISLFSEPKRIIIKAAGVRISDTLTRLIKAMNGFFLFEMTDEGLITVIPSEKTNRKPEKVENEWCYILDRFSPVNIWLLEDKPLK